VTVGEFCADDSCRDVEITRSSESTQTKVSDARRSRHGGNFTVAVGAEIPPDEPGHRATLFDPNAARRFPEGRGPGLQHSERKDPAHWLQPVSVEAALEADVEQTEHGLNDAEARLAEAKGK
jgi:hypothetical protein